MLLLLGIHHVVSAEGIRVCTELAVAAAPHRVAAKIVWHHRIETSTHGIDFTCHKRIAGLESAIVVHHHVIVETCLELLLLLLSRCNLGLRTINLLRGGIIVVGIE